ncbi:MAG: HlyD family efflux transporter periplasmic adaptor subunit [Salinibacter sp.]
MSSLSLSSLRFSLLLASLFAFASILAGCNGEDEADAHGTFEADEVTVSSEAEGQLVRFSVEEGDRLAASPLGEKRPGRRVPEGEAETGRAIVGLVDTTQLALQRRELRARRQSIRSKIASVAAEVEVLAEQLRAARRELERVRTLREGDAAPQRQVDQAEDEVRVLERRTEATRTQKASLADEIDAVNEQIVQVNERIRKSWVANPVAGTVLTAYAEKGEVVRPGEPLYTVAALDTLTLRAYVSGGQLSNVNIGQRARVFIDDGPDQRQSLVGRVTWVADESEFTPTPIQTKEERVDFVYAIELRVPNPEGSAKIGMPADVTFGAENASSSATASVAPDQR